MLKKVLLFSIASMISISMLVGCTSTDNSKATPSASVAPSAIASEVAPSAAATDAAKATEAPKATEAAKAETSNDKDKLVEKYVADNKTQIDKEIEPMKASLGSTGDIKVDGVGNELIYTFKYGSDIATDGIADQLKQQLDLTASTFEAVADQIKTATGAEKVKVTVKYLDSKDKELASKTFESK